MSMRDIGTPIEYGVTSAVTREEIKRGHVDVIKYKRERQAAELGIMIAEAKGWQMWPEGELAISRLRLYVFTPNELRDYLDAKIKEKLIEMADRTTTTPELREHLLILSERV